tara:strand:- start:807 stop:1115 length:309 start_codon:yes stop_codon:yes gene_type:complete
VLALGVGLTSSATAEDSVIEEVVVTATKRSASIQDVPFSINAQTESVNLLPNLELAPFQDIQWRSVLRSLYAMQGYQTAVQEPIDREPVLEFLFTSPTLPRA